MSRMHEDLDVSYRVLKRVSAPGHAFRSWSQLAKREHLTDDKIARALSRSADLAGGELTEVRDNRIVPTPLGKEYRDLVGPLLALAGSQTEPVETVRVSIPQGFDSGILVPAVARFTEKWGGLVALQFSPLVDGAQEAVESGSLTFAVTVQDEDSADSEERIEPAVPLSVLIPQGHRLAGADSLDSEHFASSDMLFLDAGVASRVAEFLDRVPATRRIEVGCPETLRRLVADGRGLGLAFAHPQRSALGSFSWALAVGVQPLPLRFVLPRKKSMVSEPASFLMSAIREAARVAALPLLEDLAEDAADMRELPSVSEQLTA
jgi:DNA-binding transcriptional LysR family regulator